MEENKPKTRADFDTDSEWYTYQITHPQEFENSDIEEESQKYPPIIVQCLKCGYIIDENEINPPPNESIEYKDRLKCPKCGSKKFKYIKNKEEKEKILKAQKEKEQKEKKKKLRDKEFVKATLKKLELDLKDLQKELEEWLKNNEITPQRYAALMINLTYNIYKYYRYDDRMELFFSDFREYARNVSENVLKCYYEEHELDEKLDAILAEYNEVKQFDIIYLRHSLEYANEAQIVANSSDIDVNENEVKEDVNRLEYQIESQEKYNSEVKEMLEKEQNRVKQIEDNSFFKELKRNV